MTGEKEFYTGYNRNLLPAARELRRQMTKQERRLWYDFLRFYPVKIYRQRPIDRFIVDFYCSKAHLAIEADGAQHYSEDGIIKDAERSQIIASYNIETIRYTNCQIDNNFDAVCQMIDIKIKENICRFS